MIIPPDIIKKDEDDDGNDQTYPFPIDMNCDQTFNEEDFPNQSLG